MYACHTAANQQWAYTGPDGHIVSQATGNCLTSHGAASGSFMVNEFGDGSLTFYGPFVTDFCVSAC